MPCVLDSLWKVITQEAAEVDGPRVAILFVPSSTKLHPRMVCSLSARTPLSLLRLVSNRVSVPSHPVQSIRTHSHIEIVHGCPTLLKTLL